MTSYSWDHNGNRTAAQAPTGARTTYTWDVRDRLTEILLASGARVTSTYRADELRHARLDGAGRATMVWDGRDVLAVEGANAQMFVRGPELARALGASLDRSYHEDALETVQAITGSTGATETGYVTDAWGNVLSGAASGNPYVYHGGLGYWHEGDLGLAYVRARWLDPGTGSWLSADPVAGEPRYAYVGNSPTVKIDPSGMAAIDLQWLGDELRRRVASLGPIEVLEWLTDVIPGIRQVGDDLRDRASRSVGRAIDTLERALTGSPHPRSIRREAAFWAR